MKNVIGYCRVSTKAQGTSGLGLEAQHESITRYAEQQDYKITEMVTEIASGGGSSLAHRPALEKSLADADRTGATILVAKLCRLSRSAAFVMSLMERGVAFEDVESGPERDNMMLGFKAVINEEERRRISVRTREALAAKKARGEPLGNQENLDRHRAAAVGVLKDRALAEIEPYRKVLSKLAGESLRVIARTLNDGMVKTPRGGRWHPQQVARALTRLELA